MDRERVQTLIEILKSSDASELSVTHGETTFTIKRAHAPATVSSPNHPPRAQPQPEGPGEDLVEVTARLVGLFHAGNQPGDPALVQVGDEVEEGQTIGTIEALRNFTEVISPVDGVIEDVVAGDATAVQYGDVLFLIRPAD
ncbi:MAG: acetyl-CoA carboxylase biotin carboxyl carrier protein [Armatimonadota bacterium]